MRIVINRNADTPIYLQIKNRLREMIFSDVLPAGTILPPERSLAKSLEVNRSTVIKAYQELKADGLVDSHVGKGTIVLSQAKQAALPDGYINPLPWYQLFTETIAGSNDNIIGDIMAITGGDDLISFAGGIPAPSLYPVEIMREIQADLYRKTSREMFLHSPVEGHYPLRESISYLLRQRQIAASAKDTVILSGSQQGLDFAARIFIRPGDTVLVEEPTFFGAIQIFRSAGARVIGVPIDQDGLRTDVLEALLVRHRPKFIYTLPTFQNPSGVTLSLERRYQLLNLAYQYQLPVLEDDPYGELYYDSAPVPPLKALDRHGYVIYLSTFSKSLFLGLRVGWITAPPQVLAKFAHLKQMTDLHVNTPAQFLLDAFIRRGDYDNHIALLRQEYAGRRDRMLEALGKYKVPGTSWNKPLGGYYVWCRLPDNIVRHKLVANAGKRRVVFLPGEAFYPDGTQGDTHVRLNYTFVNPDQIEPGIKHFMQAVRETATDRDLENEHNIKPLV
ncbi:PLP-dependent aminotransferase family protein [Sporomusa acidovorans]|uniref:Histidinol-phosphate aminotransferase n=1 Tax=Sporomusa acidovorans (strain ATCC 49682 / DSM 3132 / Mol) TaxID=1123286 RepID=A0ABZ3IZH7_SPOA4|nr:PLP-dependent aminotransferase family protein [Sporomusa acidovorans]OZC14179.1 2-aminoadipate transaminase [Sporomusa acidovorans DSM 3132]SDE70538.1 DNA-binding transcriptional regulator, MocR family, contains an aminotransferase domain [Sporomusa acidovorans]